jgi:hypothetical protein
MDRDTVGKLSVELSQKEPETRDPIEIERAAQKDYIENLSICVQQNKGHLPGNFYIVVITKNEKLLPNVFRNFFAARSSCPTPEYDQSVFMYNRCDDSIEYIWTVPSKDACIHLARNAHEVVAEERQLLKFVIEFANGTLYELSKKLNNELPGSLLLST